MLFKPVTIYW